MINIIVYGMGYVGIPIAALLANIDGFNVIGVQRRSKRSGWKIDCLNQGKSPFKGKEPGLDELIQTVVSKGQFKVTDDPSICSSGDYLLIDVQTPTDKTHIPQYESLKEVSTQIGKNMKKGVTIIVESTVAPGTTEGIVLPILEKESGMKGGKDFYLAFSLILAVTGSAMANTTYTETINIYRVQTYAGGFDPGSFSWFHENPAEIYGGGPMTTEQYEAAVLAGKITDVSLTITVDDLNQDDRVDVYILDTDDILQPLGELNPMSATVSLGLIPGPGSNLNHQSSTTFTLVPGWLDGLPVKIQLAGNCTPLEIETSTLSVTTAIPVPGAILLGSVGVCLVGWLRRRRAL